LLEPDCRPRIRRIVLAAAGGLGKEIALSLRVASIPAVVERCGQPFMAVGTRLALTHWRRVLPPGHIAELEAMNSQRGTARAFARTVRDIVDWRGQRQSFLARAHEIAQLPPIAVLWGDLDAIIPIAHGKALARAVKGVRFQQLTGCGHYLHHDDPIAFLRAVHSALDTTWETAPRARAASAEEVLLAVHPATPR
jgi:pimeloyl-ACP methyl ester carboxylesterase